MSLPNTFARCFSIIGLAATVALSACSGAPTETDSETDGVGQVESALTKSDLTFEVALRGTGSVSIHANVYTNAHAGVGAPTVVAVHGFTETANVWEPLANAIFETAPRGNRVKRIVAIDLPGHGQSGFPQNLPAGTNFGSLLIEDYISVVAQSIDELAERGMRPRAIYGHSMGGLIIQGLQETLLAQGSSLAQLGVVRAALLAPVPAEGQQWTQPPPSDVTPFIVFDPVLGLYLNIPPQIFQFQSFGTPAGMLVPNAPSVAEIVENGYVGIEPLNVAIQLATNNIPRPSVRRGAFKVQNGTVVAVMGFTQDILVPAFDLPPLYDHLTASTHRALSFTIDTPDAVHSMYVSNPEGMIAVLNEML
jgi:pimeloyl-ACP methyl ester carboxylesterase